MWRKLYFQNEQFEAGIANTIRKGITYISPETGLIEVSHDASMDFNTNWLFFGLSYLRGRVFQLLRRIAVVGV